MVLPLVFLGLLLRHRLDVVADQADRAFGLDRDALVQREQLLDLVDDLVELLVAAEDDVLLLEVGGELHRHEGVDAGGADVVVAARGPGILAAADRAVADVDHVLDRAPHHALGAGVGAAADGHHAGDRLDVRLDAAIGLAFLERAEVLGAALGGLVGIGLQDLVDQRLVACLDALQRWQAHGQLRLNSLRVRSASRRGAGWRTTAPPALQVSGALRVRPQRLRRPVRRRSCRPATRRPSS